MKKMHSFGKLNFLWKRYYNRNLNRKKKSELSICFAAFIHRIEAIAELQVYNYWSILFTQIVVLLHKSIFCWH